MEHMERMIDWLDRVVDDGSPDGLAAAHRAFPGAGRALVDYLEARFVEQVAGPTTERLQEWWQLLLTLATTWSPDEKAGFVARVALRVTSPGSYRWVAGFVKVAFAPTESEPWLVAALASADEATRENASLLCYYLLDGDYRLSDAGDAERQRHDPRHPVVIGDQRVA
jgi:hypothetical protein